MLRVLLVFWHCWSKWHASAPKNNIKYFNWLRLASRIGSDLVPFFYTACLPLMHRSNPIHRRHL